MMTETLGLVAYFFLVPNVKIILCASVIIVAYESPN